jgi:hypothetical protein
MPHLAPTAVLRLRIGIVFQSPHGDLVLEFTSPSFGCTRINQDSESAASKFLDLNPFRIYRWRRKYGLQRLSLCWGPATGMHNY